MRRMLLAMSNTFPLFFKFGAQTTVGKAPIGLLMLDDGALIAKSEYELPTGRCECIIIGTGEFFHGDGDEARCRPMMLVG